MKAVLVRSGGGFVGFWMNAMDLKFRNRVNCRGASEPLMNCLLAAHAWITAQVVPNSQTRKTA